MYNFQAHYHEALKFRSFHDGHIIMYVMYMLITFMTAQTIDTAHDDGDQRGWHRDSQSWGSGPGEDSAELLAVRTVY